MKWKNENIKEAQRDLIRLDFFNLKLFLKVIDNTAERLLPPPNGIGKPLGNHASSKLSGYYKIKLKALGYRVVYQLICQNDVMRVIVISVRDDEAGYNDAERRIYDLILPKE